MESSQHDLAGMLDMPIQPASAAGRALRTARERLGLSLEDVAIVTRIATRHLLALEECRFDGFSAPVYALGFARNYARAVGLPLQWTSDCMRGEVGAFFEMRGRFDLGWSAEGLRHR